MQWQPKDEGGQDATAFNAEFQLKAIQRAEERRAAGNAPHADRPRAEETQTTKLRAWKRQAGERHGADVLPEHGKLPSDEAEVRRLEREERRLTHEGGCRDLTTRPNPRPPCAILFRC